MNSQLAFFKSANDQDYNLRGIWKNYQTGIFRHRDEVMFQCWTFPVEDIAGLTPTITSLKINRIEITKYRRVVETFTLSVLLFQHEAVSATHYRWTGDTSKLIGLFSDATYDFEITDSFGNYFISNPFYLEQSQGVLVPVVIVSTIAPGNTEDIYTFQLRMNGWVLQQKYDYEELWRDVADFTTLPRLTNVTVTGGHTLNFYNELGLLKTYDASTLPRLVSVAVDGDVVTFTDYLGATTVINTSATSAKALKIAKIAL